MPKLDIEFEITGLKLKIKGDGDDVSGKVADLQHQVQRIVSTIGALAQESAAPSTSVANSSSKLIDAPPPNSDGNSLGRSRKPARRSASSSRETAEAVDFRHDAEKYGFPRQEWTTAQKSMWTLYILEGSTDSNEFSAGVIAATFNRHFKSFGTILAPNVHRDLGKEKGKSGAVNSDSTQQPIRWYLLDSGKKQMAALVAEVKGSTPE